jgi:hypothetical protein
MFSQVKVENDIDFLISKLKNVYAGYSYKVKPFFFDKLIQNVKNSNSKDTFGQLAKLTSHFDDYHVSLFTRFSYNNVDTLQNAKNLKTIKNSLNNKSKSLKEGYWINELNSNIIYLKQVKKNYLEGYLVESYKKAPIGQCVLKIDCKKKYETDFINFDMRVRLFTKSNFRNKNSFTVGSYGKWKKIENYHDNFLIDKIYLKLKPSIKKIDSNCVLILMPDFEDKSIKVYDSLINANFSIISTAKTLIIDLRNNAGGYIDCFLPLLPLIAKKPLVGCSSVTLCSNDVIDNAKEMLDFYVKKNDSIKASYQNKYLQNILAFKGRFNLIKIDSFKFEPKESKIKNVALITNYATRSAAELMVLYFRDGVNAQIFGENTAGAVDYLNIFDYKLPVSKHNLWLGTVKRVFTKKQPSYDKNGISPNIFINPEIEDWHKFVKEYYEKN